MSHAAAGSLRVRWFAYALAGAAALASSLLSQPVHALQVPAITAHVNDYAQLMPADRASALEARLTAHEQNTGQQFALLTIPSLEGDEIETFSIAVAEKWKLGRKGKDDGLIVVVAANDHKMRIEVGYGLEGQIPDAIASRVIRDVLTPAFRQNDFSGGLDSAFSILIDRAGGGSGEIAAPASARSRTKHKFSLLPFLLPLIFFFLFSRGGGRRRGMWVAPMIMGGMGGRGGFGGGGFGGGGGGGGGFGGGGGGGFGGGGASGGW